MFVAKQPANTWRYFIAGVLSYQDKPIQAGARIEAFPVGTTLLGKSVLRITNGLYTLRAWFNEEPEVETPETHPPTPVPSPAGLWIVRGDEELAEFNYQSRTAATDWAYLPQTPSVFRFDKYPVQRPTEYRVDITRMDPELRRLNGYDSNINRINYLYSSGTALFNRTGFPKLQYLTMSFNLLEGLAIENGCLKFKTLRPASNTAGMTHETHPHYVHRWDIVTIKKDANGQKYTAHVNTPHGDVFWFLTSWEGYGYIPLHRVKPYEEK